MRLGKERRFAVRGNHVWAGNGILPFVENAPGRGKPFWVLPAFALGEHHPFGFLEKLRRDKENLFGWKPLLRWGSTTRAGFGQNHAISVKTPHGLAKKPSGGTYSCIVFQSCIFCYTFPMISDDLRKIISERGIRQKDICKALGLSQSYTSELLSGKKEFSLDLLERLCDFLQVDIKLVDKHRQ